ncbi:MAG TPA: Uma2 family endonuclease [Blastocatellia bacterium]
MMTTRLMTTGLIIMTTEAKATFDDLYTVPEGAKAEIVDGEIVLMSPTGADPGYAGDEIFVSLREYSHKTGTGRAVGDNKAFHVHLPNRESFSPDAAFYIGPDPGMRFYEGAPIFAVEVRSENDYGPAAERRIAEKRADYIAAGTLVLLDADLLSPDVIRSYTRDDPDHPRIFRAGEIADAEPALPGWRFPVDNLFK